MSTQVSQSPETQRHVTSRPVVVGVDGVATSSSAVLWGCAEAVALGVPLTLVTACDATAQTVAGPAPITMDPASYVAVKRAAEQDLRKVARGLLADAPQVELAVVEGTPREVLLRLAADSDLLVVGRRGLGAAHRLLVGSTSLAVAGRAPVTVVVVPETWVQASRSTAPVVVGVAIDDTAADADATLDEDSPDGRVLRFAFEHAARLRVPVVAVSAWDLPALYSWSPADITASRARHDAALERRLAPWRERYPDVELSSASVAEPSAQALLDAASVAQLVVVGRHTAPRHVGGFRFGSTARGVLHHASCPVAVVPAYDVPAGEHDPTAL